MVIPNLFRVAPYRPNFSGQPILPPSMVSVNSPLAADFVAEAEKLNAFYKALPNGRRADNISAGSSELLPPHPTSLFPQSGPNASIAPADPLFMDVLNQSCVTSLLANQNSVTADAAAAYYRAVMALSQSHQPCLLDQDQVVNISRLWQPGEHLPTVPQKTQAAAAAMTLNCWSDTMAGHKNMHCTPKMGQNTLRRMKKGEIATPTTKGNLDLDSDYSGASTQVRRKFRLPRHP
ncbi:unnamed protein product [Protopolystoma xenopodis]|uniref:Uncharacterized protein n=1 Tax=Protopolystoma xenopodis TaxID=117903 RepID=A0A448WIF2_9PLAT|nr:unnamed protein product [Protopolystoma xenopodis]